MEFCGIIAQLCRILHLHYQHGQAMNLKELYESSFTRIWRFGMIEIV